MASPRPPGMEDQLVDHLANCEVAVAMTNAASEFEDAATSLNRAAASMRAAFGPWLRVPLEPTRPIARQPLPLPPQQQDPVVLAAMVEAMKEPMDRYEPQ